MTPKEFYQGILTGSIGCTGCLINLSITTAIGCIIALFVCHIRPEETYSWYSGIWHALFLVPNWIISLFNSEILYKANHYTTAYNVWWWITISLEVLAIIGGGGSNRD